jgi:hypothetical protein
MAASSGFSPSPAETLRSSNAIPHFGQAPGLSDCTSGCIGQVYFFGAGGVTALSRPAVLCGAALCEAASLATSVIPHFGHEPGVSDCTSGCIGQVYLFGGIESTVESACGALAVAIMDGDLYLF